MSAPSSNDFAPRRPSFAVRRRRAPAAGVFSWRATVAVALIVVGCLLAPVAVLGVWAGNQVSDTGRWVATVQPLIHDPAIQNVLTDKITNQITSQIDVPKTVNQASTELNSAGLPRISSALKTFGPQIASGVTGFIRSAVHAAISSQAMANAWVQVNTVAHQAVVKVLSGEGNGAISTSNGQVVLNIGPLIAVAKQNLVARGFTLANNIPTVNPTVPLFEDKYLTKAQTGYRLVKALRIALPILALALLAAGVYVARRHRRALIWAALGLSASMLVLGAALLIARDIYLNSVPSNVLPADAAAAAFDAMVHYIRIGLRVVLVVGLVIAAAGFLTGPSRAAVQTRSGLQSGLAWVRNAGERRGVSAGPVGDWTYRHRTGLRIGSVALAALIFVFWGQPTGLFVLILVIILVAVLGLIELIGRPASPAGT